MIQYTQGNLLEADVEALVNTVNTVGVMGKGIALMFKERFPKNTAEYEKACKQKQVKTGQMFITATGELMGPCWVINFPTKEHWRNPSKIAWIIEGLRALKQQIIEKQIKSIAIPPLGAGNGKLPWPEVKMHIERELSDLTDVTVLIYEPTDQYQNVVKRSGAEKLTPARALVAEMVRRYWVLGMECSILEIQKLAWFLERAIIQFADDNPLKLQFIPHKFGPYSENLRHLLNTLDGSYLRCNKRLGDAQPQDVICFNDSKADQLALYLKSKAIQPYKQALSKTIAVIDGFETPFGMELLATVDWLIQREGVAPENILQGLNQWPYDQQSIERKKRIFSTDVLTIAVQQLNQQHWL